MAIWEKGLKRRPLPQTPTLARGCKDVEIKSEDCAQRFCDTFRESSHQRGSKCGQLRVCCCGFPLAFDSRNGVREVASSNLVIATTLLNELLKIS
jgi:hypothetical protein